jgi:hypothetical protein
MDEWAGIWTEDKCTYEFKDEQAYGQMEGLTNG